MPGTRAVAVQPNHPVGVVPHGSNQSPPPHACFVIDSERGFLHLRSMSDEHAVLAANAAYYVAFARGDVAAMNQLWAEDGISCIHPGWPVLVGRQVVLDSYRNILRNPQRERIAHQDHTVLVAGDESRVLCVEIVSGTGFALAATNCFRRIDGAWRLIHHQASPIASLLSEAPPSAPPPQRLN